MPAMLHNRHLTEYPIESGLTALDSSPGGTEFATGFHGGHGNRLKEPIVGIGIGFQVRITGCKMQIEVIISTGFAAPVEEDVETFVQAHIDIVVNLVVTTGPS